MTVKLQQGLILADTDPAWPVLPSALWNEVARVGFHPVRMEILARGTFESDAFQIDGTRWPFEGELPAGTLTGPVWLAIKDGAEDPPRVEPEKVKRR